MIVVFSTIEYFFIEFYTNSIIHILAALLDAAKNYSVSEIQHELFPLLKLVTGGGKRSALENL